MRYFPKKKEAERPNIPPKLKARTFQTTLEAVKDVADVASSNFLINGLAANTLFDSGANYSFISHKFGGRLALPIEKLDNALVVEVSSGKFIHVRDCIKNIVIDLNENKFHKELLPIDLKKFGILLGIDWLSVNNADIKCRKKIVVIKQIGREPLMVYGDKHRVNSRIISLMKAKKCWSKGCTSYLAFVIDEKN